MAREYGRYVRPPRMSRDIYLRLKAVQEELQLTVEDTIDLLIDLYEDVKNKVLVTRDECGKEKQAPVIF